METILIAAGGTGGHLFPAQALAEELSEKGFKILFAGSGLQGNRFFNSQSFPYRDIPSISPFTGWRSLLKAPWIWGRGIRNSLKMLEEHSPSLVIGFGSYHTFPILAAASWKKIPFVLFEPDSHPGRVNRLFSKRARFTAVQFDEMDAGLKGNMYCVEPLVRRMMRVDRQKACNYFSLDVKKKTLLVFGGSQGALSLNRYLKNLTPRLKQCKNEWQLLHFTGLKENWQEIEQGYRSHQMTACVKPFEQRMEYAWSLADLLLSRSGATTIAEQLFFGVPAIFIPFPHATADHQAKNAELMVKKEAAFTVREEKGCESALLSLLEDLMNNSLALEQMKQALLLLKEERGRMRMSELILREVGVQAGRDDD
ncbi:MAG: hypothetical protein A2Y28_02465 [Chlamydiae bacterium GWC2_50_10]|nr:MAG: hypothetical protein A2Z85_03025 [Chlamydiae bacterium GWA2_50_15]OGN54730.1 MAG: hypothetical protein A2098_02605 [Chlamydiae bacterium GWF2_49_8]OGN54903.1 MAG: hypothetical protein A2Y28_02465 [Chlamydiae bacterium GWC2_50_10]OGN58570.1 MAG: hypothetical protein A3D18_00980 [Chlamydiae bacterium RIFCSPHIGHO2_02_FULL_49_29]OGN70294.1 MAG: hypothetical protein A3I15_02715 [Chlamydiae bacterium RIFCSPLOWO2_02_FULL_49_12]